MQTSNSLALYAWFIAMLAGSHSFHLVRALSRFPSLDGAYIIYLRSKKVNNFENFFLLVFLVFRAFHVVLTLFCIISVDFIEILRFSCTEHQRKKGEPTRKAGSPNIYSLVISQYSPETQPTWLPIFTACQPLKALATYSSVVPGATAVMRL